ncbi:phosphotransferase family protein [Mesorhizobium sp. BAC0120]|uniref:phosphotransferase family protein n=1 Tax=Mesorhizobium sp. BAC0120 TaxID=3090670 RepID=UPI00298D03C4|nr:phosphotransferase family protein [Mesorhizobium sp. BAC0120]MDW6026582.1 phosphotransferase family protein [Mesorhizobium sp. BAC0120]
MEAVRRKLDFEPARLKQFLDARFGEGEIELERIAGGQSNPTYYLVHRDRRMVLRKQPAGPILKGAHAVDREFRALSALAGTGVPVPRPVLFHTEPDIVGTPFFLMERLKGRVFHDPALPGVRPEERRAIYLAMAGALAKLHAVRPEEVGLGDFGRPGNYFERQIARWSKQWRESQTKDIPAIDFLSEWLTRNVPPDDTAVAIAHGDFRLGNLLFHPTEPRVLGILDWELSTLGHPLADLGYCSMAWHTTPEEYGGIRGLDLATLGIPSLAEFVARYNAEAPPSGPLQPFHIVFSLFRFAVIFVGIADRVRAGTAAAENADRLAPLAARFAERGLELAGIADKG